MGLPKLPTLRSLECAALHYLERFSASSVGVQHVLMRRVYKACIAHDLDPIDYKPMVETVIVALQARGYLNDSAFAENRVHSLHRQGRGPRRIRETLLAKGVDRETTETVLREFLDNNPDAEWESIQNLVRKRGLGPFRLTAESRQKHRQKDFSTLVRAGFSIALIRKILETDEAGGDSPSGF